MKRSNKKGFTIVELVIVIAVVAILAAVLIPTFASLVKKANASADTQLVRDLNTAIAVYVNDALDGDEATMADALAAAKEFGYDIEKINAKADGNEILFDSVNKVFCYLNEGTVEYVPEYPNQTAIGENEKYKYWVIDDDGNTETSTVYSSYVTNVAAGTTVVANNSIDVTACAAVNVAYNGNGTVSIYTNGGNVSVANSEAEVYHYGSANEVAIAEVADNSYHVFADVVSLKIAKGNVVPEKGAKIQVLIVVGAEVTVEINTEEVEIANVVIDQEKASAIVDTIKEAVKDVVEADSVVEVATEQLEDVITGATLFAGGLGTKENPYQISTKDHMANIANVADKSNYFELAGDVDLSGWNAIEFNGSFNGKGHKITGLDSRLFSGLSSDLAEGCVVSDVDITCNIQDYSGDLGYFVCLFYPGRGNATKITLDNVDAHGFITGTTVSTYIGYGANVKDVIITNCESDVTLQSGHCSGFVCHVPNANITIEDSKYAGAMYYSNSANYVTTNWNNGTLTYNISESYDVEGLYTGSGVNGMKYTGNANKYESGSLALAEKYAAFEVNASSGSTYAVAQLIIGAQGTDGKPNYTGVYMSETLTAIDGKYVTSEVKNYDITINNTSAKAGLTGNVYNVINSYYTTQVDSATVVITQYSENGTIVRVDTVSIK